MKKYHFIFLMLIIAFLGCKPAKYTQLGDGLFADIQTNKGDIMVKLYYEQTPITVASFVSLAEGKSPFVTDSLKGKPYYDGVIFHRVIKDFVIQGGDPTGTGSGSPGYKFEDEFVDTLKHSKKGILSMANSGVATNGSQFFITLTDTPHLDAYTENGILKACEKRKVSCHTVFGEVVNGLDIVDSIALVKTQRDRPVEDVVMNHVEIVRNGKPAKQFDAVTVMTSYFEEAKKREEEARRIQAEKAAKAKEVQENLAAEFVAQESSAKLLPSGLRVLYINKSDGKKPKIGQRVKINYAGFLADGTLFDTSWLSIAEAHNKVDPVKQQRDMYSPASMLCSPEASLIHGFREGILRMRVGDKVRLFIPSHLGYGDKPYGPIPANSNLVFDVEMVAIEDGK